MALDQLTRTQKVLLWALSNADDLVEKGLLRHVDQAGEGAGATLSDEGRAAAQELAASGFQPTREEIRSVAEFLVRGDGCRSGS